MTVLTPLLPLDRQGQKYLVDWVLTDLYYLSYGGSPTTSELIQLN